MSFLSRAIPFLPNEPHVSKRQARAMMEKPRGKGERAGGMRNAECGMRNAECGMRNAECGMRNVAGGKRKVECGRRQAVNVESISPYPDNTALEPVCRIFRFLDILVFSAFSAAAAPSESVALLASSHSFNVSSSMFSGPQAVTMVSFPVISHTIPVRLARSYRSTSVF